MSILGFYLAQGLGQLPFGVCIRGLFFNSLFILRLKAAVNI